MCSRKSVKYSKINSQVVLDTKHFINGINDLRPTLKINSNFTPEYQCPETRGTSNPYKKSTLKSQHLKDKKIELWNEKEVINLIKPKTQSSSSKASLSNSTSQASKSTINAFLSDQTADANKNRLIQIFKEFKLNPYLSPLINQLQTHSDLRNVHQNKHERVLQQAPVTPQFYRRSIPNNPPVTPMY